MPKFITYKMRKKLPNLNVCRLLKLKTRVHVKDYSGSKNSGILAELLEKRVVLITELEWIMVEFGTDILAVC